MIYLEWQYSATRHRRMPGLYPPGIFVFLLCFLCGAETAWSDCLPEQPLQALEVAAVSDGDSLRLKDGRRLRLVSINSPEVAKQGRNAEAFANEAKALLSRLAPTGKKVYLHLEGQDHYGRTLASAFQHRDGGHLGEALLRAGLAVHIVVPPSSQPYRDCLRAAEAEAKQAQRGLWSRPPLQASALTRHDQGFQRLQGTMLGVEESRHAFWIRLEGDVVLQVTKRDLPFFGNIDLRQWQGQELEVRGWLRQRRPPRPGLASLVMDLRHPDMWQCLNCRKGQQ